MSLEKTENIAVLTYWEGRGRAEIIRYILGCAQIQFKENYLRGRPDFEKLMPNMLFNQVPLLQIDGINVIQTHAIIRYIADNYDLMPNAVRDRARCNELWEGLRDMQSACQFVYRNWNTPDNQENVKKFDAQIKTGLEKWLPKFSGLLTTISSESGYLINNEQPYVCDYILYYFLECADELVYGKTIIQANPRISIFLQQMRERLEVKAHLASSHVHGPTTVQYKKEVMISLGRLKPSNSIASTPTKANTKDSTEKEITNTPVRKKQKIEHKDHLAVTTTPQKKKTMAVLTYWEGRGRAEIIRYILGCASIDFKENYLRGRSDFEKLMPNMLFNQVPLLQIDGIDIIQTQAIVRYIANNYDLMPKSVEERARCNELWEGLRDMQNACQFVYRNWNTPDNPENVNKYDAQIKAGLEKWLPKFSTLLTAISSENGYLINNERPYVCDYIFYYFLECADELVYGKAIIQANPRVAVFLQHMRERPEIQAHLASSHVHGPTTIQYKKEVKASLGR